MADAQSLDWPPQVAEAVAAEAGRTYPEEACGLLLGTAGRLVSAVPLPNGASDEERRTRYVLSPGAYRRAEEQARIEGLDVVGVFHSHPDHPAEPSPTDLAEAWPEWVYVIVPVEAGRPGTPRAWRLAGDRKQFVSVRLHAPA